MSKQALMVLAEGFEDIEAVAPIDVLTRAGVEVTVVGLTDRPTKGAYGTTLMTDAGVAWEGRLFDAIVFPGGRRNAAALAVDRRVVESARRHFGERKLVAAICAAPSHVLAEAAGLLKGKRATGDPAFNDRLAAAGAIVTGQPVTRDNNIITGMGPGAAIPFSLALAEYLVSNEVADSFAVKWGIPR
ncbi:MAG: DJ-1/PfpI family protein [Candidatus Zixiibacteriota bacterium]